MQDSSIPRYVFYSLHIVGYYRQTSVSNCEQVSVKTNSCSVKNTNEPHSLTEIIMIACRSCVMPCARGKSILCSCLLLMSFDT